MQCRRRIVAPLVVSAAVVLSSGAVAFAAPGAGASKTRISHAHGLLARVATVEGVTPKALRQDLKQGATLVSIAGSKYASAGDLAVALLAPEKTKLDQAVTAQHLTAAQETVKYTALLSKVTTLAATPHPLHGLRQSLSHHGMRLSTKKVVAEIAGTCSTTPTALTTLLRVGGTSVLAACQTTNSTLTQAQLTAVIFTPFQAKLDAAVTAGKLTQARAEQRGAQAQRAIGKALTKTLKAHTGAHA